MSIEEISVGTTPSSTLTPVTFSGVSNYASDFQSVIDRAVNIAQLPITQLTNETSDISSEEQLATGIQSAVATLATTVTALGNLGTNQGITGSSSDTSLAEVSNTTTTTPGSYTLSNISSLAAAASYTTTNGYADATTTAVSTTGTMQLDINGTPSTIDLTGSGDNNLNGLASAINALDLGVTASVIDTGTGSTPYYLSLSENATGQNTIQLVDDPTGADTQVALTGTDGSNASFEIAGQTVTSASNTISNVIPGMSFTLTGTTTGSQSVTLTAASDSSQISDQLQNFVGQYNAVQTLLNAQIGSNAGLLTGNSMISGVESALQSLLNYQAPGGGAIQNLTELGVGMQDTTGVLTFNQSTADPTLPPPFDSLSSSQIAAAFSFLGSSTSGFGVLASNLTEWSDSVTGEIAGQETEWQTDTTNINTQITNLTDQATQMQTNLQAELQAADSQIAQLQSQQQILSESIQSENFTAFGYNNTNTQSFTPSDGG